MLIIIQSHYTFFAITTIFFPYLSYSKDIYTAP